MILFLRFRSDSESALRTLADKVKVLQKQVPGFTLVHAFEPLYQDEGSNDLPLFPDGFDEMPHWISVREDCR